SYGKPIKMVVTDTKDTYVTSFEYAQSDQVNDGGGNLIRRIEPNGLITKIEYDSKHHAFPIKKIVQGVKDADGNAVGDIITEYEYNLDTGMKIAEIDPLFKRTNYEYDKLNRITKVILPVDDGPQRTYREYLFSDTENNCLFYNEN